MFWEAMSWKKIPEGWNLGAEALINQFKVAYIYQNTSHSGQYDHRICFQVLYL
jgi:hypothetical protein